MEVTTGSGGEDRKWRRGQEVEVDLVGGPDELEDVDLCWRILSIGQQGVQVGSGRSHSLVVHYVVQVPDNTLTVVTWWDRVGSWWVLVRDLVWGSLSESWFWLCSGF